jgi:hypothetical protein
MSRVISPERSSERPIHSAIRCTNQLRRTRHRQGHEPQASIAFPAIDPTCPSLTRSDEIPRYPALPGPGEDAFLALERVELGFDMEAFRRGCQQRARIGTHTPVIAFESASRLHFSS